MSDDTSKHIVLTYLDTIGANGYTEKYVDDLANLIDAARSAALEEAAKVADIEASTDKYATDSQAHRIAAAIRELK